MLSRARSRGSGTPSPRSTTLNRSAGRWLTTSFTVRFCAFVFASSANDGVNTVIIKIFVGYTLVSPMPKLVANRSPLVEFSICCEDHLKHQGSRFAGRSRLAMQDRFEVLSRDGTVETIPNSGASREMNNNVWLETLKDGL